MDFEQLKTFQLDDSGAYVSTGVHRDKLVLSEPFPIDIDLQLT